MILKGQLILKRTKMTGMVLTQTDMAMMTMMDTHKNKRNKNKITHGRYVKQP